MRLAEAKRELATHRRRITLADKEQVDVWLSDGYPYGVDRGEAEVWNLATSEAARYGISPDVAPEMAEMYREGSEIFGGPCIPQKFVDTNLRRLAPLPRMATIKEKVGIDTQDQNRERRLRKLTEAYASSVAPGYGLDPQDASSKAGRYVAEVLLPHSRDFQDRLRQTPSGSL